MTISPGGEVCSAVALDAKAGAFVNKLTLRDGTSMQVATGTVVNGQVVLEGISLAEGALVAVVTRGADECFALTGTQEDELLDAMSEIERGDFVTLDQLLVSLPR